MFRRPYRKILLLNSIIGGFPVVCNIFYTHSVFPRKGAEGSTMLLLKFALLNFPDEILVYKLTMKDDTFNQDEI